MTRSIYFLGFLFLSATVSAQESKRISLQDAVKTGLTNNVNLNQQKNLLRSSKVTKLSGALSLGPTVNVNGNAGTNNGNTFIQQVGIVNGESDFANANLNAVMPLFSGLSNINMYRQSSSLYEAQFYNVHRTSQDVIRDVSRQYLACLLDEQLVKINGKNLETQQRQKDLIAEHVNAGSRAEVDLKNQEYQVKNAELTLLRSKNTLRNDKAMLSQILLLDPSITIDLEEPSWTVDDLSGVAAEELYKLASETRGDLRRAESSEKAAQFGYRSARGRYLPSVSAFAQYGSAYNYIYPNTLDANPANRSFDQQFLNDNTSLTYGISFTIPIYGAFQNRANAARTRAAFENAKLQTENTAIIVKTEVLLAYQNLQDAITNFTVAQAQLQAAETANALEKERYDLGISDIVAFTISTQYYTQAQADYASSRYTLMFQKLLINHATGTLKFEDVP